MKSQALKLSSLLIIFAVSMAYSGTNSSLKSESGKKQQEEKELARKNQPSLFPVVVAGSIAIIQKVYLKKTE